MTVAVRNPLKERTLVLLSLEGVPYGYRVYFPHRWVWLDPLAERKLDLLIVPWLDFQEMKFRKAPIRLYGRVPRVYTKSLDITGVPGSWMAPIGGILANVTPKHKGEIRLDPEVRPEQDEKLTVTGGVTPHVKDQKLRVDMTCPDGSTYAVDAWTDERGRFSGTFSLYPRRKIRKPEEPVAKGQNSRSVYAFQAHLLYASQIAPTDSNIVFWQKTGDDGKGLDQTLDREPQVEPTLARSAVMRRARPMKEVRH